MNEQDLSNPIVPVNPNKPPIKSSIRKSILGIREHQEKRRNELMGQVVEKLMTDMVKGRVSFFHDKKTGQLDTEVYTLNLKSEKLPNLHCSVWKHFKREFDIHPNPLRLYLYIYDHQPDERRERTMHVTQRWGASNNDFELELNRPGDKLLSLKDQINFLQDILATEVDERRLEQFFGRPYQKGDVVSNSRAEDPEVHTAYWVRDLWSGEPLLSSGPLPEPKALSNS